MADNWSSDQIIIALEFYYSCPERMHTDSHEKCKEVAAMIDRSPGALDKIIRNIKQTDTNSAGLKNASTRIRKLVAKYKNNIPQLKQDAANIRAKNGWAPLDCDA